ncbi:pentatricopeptide repeat-containing protein At1g69290 [Mercurialis annua]|uniref:pentatricopeptide repeat-containing protein At1g69290 n=1 Tax=Mercurialis annua TaxID=3986 RepID=UPI00215E5FD5|nr:pentatricopeptide repeat-containing protein At1g69290 [Mercurialis annua]XP_050237393.1 pentatricopeptide repeat-containing protein At1g69290 [Mercurialis annua]XP_055962162.1 pentatricopeptide repeat-containing protein At1g69290 [Mercurialis annua]
MWRRKAITFLPKTPTFSSSSSPSQPSALYSFLEPTIFALKKQTPTTFSAPKPTPPTLTLHHITTLESNIHNSILTNDTDQAWKSFKSLTSNPSSYFPSKSLTNSVITHLCSCQDTHNLKRAFASVVFLIEKNPQVLEFETVRILFEAMKSGNVSAPAFALVKCMFKNRFFMPFDMWGGLVGDICRMNGKFVAFLNVFEESYRISVDEKLGFMKPDLGACNLALESCCKEIESVSDADRVLEIMSVLGVKPDELSFGFLAYLYALKGLREKIIELKDLMNGFGVSNKILFFNSLVSGYVKAGNLESVLEATLCSLREENGRNCDFDEGTYCEVVKGFLKDGNLKGLANFIVEAQKVEAESVEIDKSIGFGVINACVKLGFSDKAHSIVDEMDAKGGSVGLGVYVPILKAYCKESRTAEATQLVMDISNSGLQLDAGSYDALIDASMTSQDFQSAFTLFREMRESRTPDLKGSYLTIMTGLMENHRPELMAAFLDEVVEDPRIEVKTHDWNSIIHAFCKAGRMEDAKRTFRRMFFLKFEPNDQTYLSLINGYVTAEKYFSVLMLWNEVKRKVSNDKEKGLKFDQNIVDAFLYALVKGGFFDAVMQVVEKSQEMKIFVDKWRYKQAFMETHKKLKVTKLRKRSFRKMESLIAFKNWAGLNA